MKNISLIIIPGPAGEPVVFPGFQCHGLIIVPSLLRTVQPGALLFTGYFNASFSTFKIRHFRLLTKKPMIFNLKSDYINLCKGTKQMAQIIAMTSGLKSVPSEVSVEEILILFRKVLSGCFLVNFNSKSRPVPNINKTVLNHWVRKS